MGDTGDGSRLNVMATHLGHHRVVNYCGESCLPAGTHEDSTFIAQPA